ncbi:MAG: hypothetical protein JNK90_22235 [Planctomycetaceae bacterium]|nr:hypothetical protein [Planctomycetaceae bacterium]
MTPEHCMIIGFVTFFLTTAINRFLGERNYRTLSQEDKVKLIDAFATHRSLGTYIPIGVMLIMFAVSYTIPQTLVFVFPASVVLLLIFSIALQVTILRRLKELTLPADYVAKFFVQSCLAQVGNIIALSMFTFGIVGQFS